MARVLLYERVVDAVLTRTSPSHDMEIQNRVKIKDEPVDTTTLNIDTTDTLVKNLFNFKNDTLDKNCLNMINRDESSLSVNDISPQTVNSRKSKHVFNSHSAYINSTDKTNLKRKRTTVERNALSQSKKKRSNDFQISKNENINAFTKTTEKFEEKKKQQNISSNSRTKMQHTNQLSTRRDPTECNICFRKFPFVQNCESHKQYYNRDYKCKNCNRHFITRKKLNLHVRNNCNKTHYVYRPSNLFCNFCNRVFRNKFKALLQSHIFHEHSELINSSNIIKRKKLKPKNVNTFCKKATLKTNTHKESPRTNNLMKSEKQNALINKNESWNDDDMVKTDAKNLKTEELFNNGMSSTKKLRQPTLTEYLEFCKRKRNINASPNKFNIDSKMKDSFPSALSYDEREVKTLKPKFSKIYNKQVDSSSTKTNNLEQMTHSTMEQDKNCEESKKPFVKLHADVEMMKSFLEKLPNRTTEDKGIKDQRNDMISCYHEMPYSLRSLKTIAFAETIPNLRKRKIKDISEKSQLNTERNTRTKHDDTDKIVSNFWKTIMVRFKCKNCRIILTRCDEKIRNCHQIATTETTFKENISFSSQCNSISFQESDIQNKMVLKKLEVSLERLATVPDIDVKEKTVSEVEKCNDGFFLCKVCKKSFFSKSDKHMHIKSSHIAYMSSICDARYKLKHKLLQHYLSEHLSKQNQCCICYVLLSDYVELKRHLSIHCLKYIRRENDQYPIDIDIKCSLIKNTYKCFRCNMVFLTQSELMIHQSFCILQEEMTEDQKVSMKKINTLSKIIFKMQSSKNADGLTVTHDEKINFNECSSKKSVEITNKHQISLINEEDPKIAKEESKINENKQNSFVNNNLVTKKIETINESQNSAKLLENDNPTINNHDVANAQVDAIKSKIVEEESKINEDKQNSFVNNNLVMKKIETINESQNFEELLKNDNSMISNHDIANAQVNTIKSKIIIYPCDVCGKQFHSHKNLQQHKRTFKDGTDLCPICCTAFSSKRLLQTHITAAHVPEISKTYNFHCVFCNQGFIKKYELRPHILHLHDQELLNTLTRDSHTSKKKPSSTHTAVCNICNLVFETYDRYMDHKMYYYKNHTFTCSLCAQNFQGMYMLDHHNKLTHYSEDKRKSYNYICDICNEGFNLESHFHSHNMHVHWNEKKLTEIAKESKERSRLDASEVQEQINSTNQQKEIEQSNENICQICQLKCIDTNDMENHIAFYSNDGDFKCDRCKRQFRTLNLLYKHRTLTHICRDIYNGHICHVCGEVLETAILLECHKKHFHLNDIVCNNADDCKNCEHTSSSNSNEVIKHPLNSNDVYNTAKYRYNCLFCNMKFLSADAIQAHIIQTHIDDLFVEHTTLSSISSMIKDDNIRKQFVQQRVKVNQASILTSVATTISAAATITSTSETTTIAPVTAITTSTLSSSAAAATTTSATTTTSTSAAATTISTLATTTATTTSAAAATTTSISATVAATTTTATIAATTTSATTTATTTSATTTATTTSATTTATTTSTSATTTSTSETVAAATFQDNYRQFLQDNTSNNILGKHGVKIKKTYSSFDLPNKIKVIVPADNKIALKVPTMPSINEIRNNVATPVASSSQFNQNSKTSILPTIVSTKSTNKLRKNDTSDLKSKSINEFRTNIIPSMIKSDFQIFPVIQSNGSRKIVIVPQTIKSNAITNKNSNYMCPLCPLEYPSLFFFNAHLKYAHADFIQTDNPQLNQLTQKGLFLIKCLLCLSTFTDENEFKSHLKNYIHIPNSENVKKKDDNNQPTQESLIKCVLCSFKFTDKEKYKSHLKNSHNYVHVPKNVKKKDDNQPTQISLIKCLLCSFKFADKNKYKSHLKNSHNYVHVPNSKNVKKKDDNKNSTTPEIIIVDDDDDNVGNSLDQPTVETTVMLGKQNEKQNEKFGKLRVKPFAKIMENLSKEHALKVQSKQVSHSS